MVELIIGLFVMLAGAAGVFFKQRNDAREEAENAKREAAYEKDARLQQQVVEKARAESRKQSQEVQNEADSRPSTTKPSGHFRR